MTEGIIGASNQYDSMGANLGLVFRISQHG